MTEPARIQQLGELIDFDAWRFAGVSEEERNVILARRAAAHPPAELGWSTLSWIGQTDKRDAIRIYARLGLHPILLHGITAEGGCTCGRADCSAATGKHPVHAGWQRESLNLDALDAELIETGRFNVGLRMGEQPGGFALVCLDVDGPPTLLADLERKNGQLPATLTASTGKGFHYIFRVPAELAFKNRVKLADRIDVRAEGGQIVAAPSVHASGRRYTWVRAIEPAELPL